MSALAVLFLLFDSDIHVMRIAPVRESFAQLGYPVSLALGLGVLELVCIAVYLIPRTATLGAIVLTGYLGGATAAHVRIGVPFFPHVMFRSTSACWSGQDCPYAKSDYGRSFPCDVSGRPVAGPSDPRSNKGLPGPIAGRPSRRSPDRA